jgi:D-3-phosphoglycerate dehydrogenase
MNILFLEPENYSKAAIAVYKNFGRVFFWPELNKTEKKNILGKTDILVVRLKYKIDASWMEKMPDLKFIVSPTTGLNHIDLNEAQKRKIKVFSLRGQTIFLKNITSTAEETLALILALVRKIPWAFDEVKKGVWNRDTWKGGRLNGKILGILGCGRLGKMLVGYGRALGMKVIGYDPKISNTEFLKHKIKKVSVQELFKQADVLSVHISLEVKTRNFVNLELFELMKPSAYFINTSRGEVVDEKALLSVLKKRKIAGAALDVMFNEVGGKHLKNNPLIDYAKSHQNLIITPHIGGATHEDMCATEEFVAGLVTEQLNRYGKE